MSQAFVLLDLSSWLWLVRDRPNPVRAVFASPLLCLFRFVCADVRSVQVLCSHYISTLTDLRDCSPPGLAAAGLPQ